MGEVCPAAHGLSAFPSGKMRPCLCLCHPGCCPLDSLWATTGHAAPGVAVLGLSQQLLPDPSCPGGPPGREPRG